MRLIICLVLCLTVCGWSNVTPAVQPQSDCENVRGTVEAQITGMSDACPVATIAGVVFDETGTQIGTTTACILSLDQRGNGSIPAELTHVYSLGDLNFSTHDQGVLNLIAPDLYRFENRLTIVDGASGFLRARGIVNFASGEINLKYNGRICVN
ncbi:MAG: hypothetical protein ACRD6N_15670 [Pyrinomonadaceae bacterium]